MSDQLRSSTPGHTKNKSLTKSRPRSSTKGPLDAEDNPLTSTQAAPKTQEQQHKKLSQRIFQSPHPLPNRSAAGTPVPLTTDNTRPNDFSFLLRPEVYHPLTALNVPPPFRDSNRQPSPDASLEELLSKGHFRAAAIAAVQQLTESGPGGAIDPRNAKKIFDLLYTRLTCLTLIDATPLAAQEAKLLNDLGSQIYIDEATGEHLVPWELRVLLVRLQAMGFGDSRRAVASYHDLAREARDGIGKATTRHDNSAREVWKARLDEIGIKVAGALIEMQDLAGAAAHLSSLRDKGDSKMALTKALMWLNLGDVENARNCARNSSRDLEVIEQVISALCDMADGEYEAALERWQELRENSEDEMIGVNAAVCLVYLGKLDKGREILEDMVNSGQSSHTLLSNLSTIYELCTEKNRNLKLKLADRVSKMEESETGWEKFNNDFKL